MVVLSVVFAQRASAQVTETPIAFDSAGKVQTLTPQLVARFNLRGAAWPVQRDFREARLFAVSGGGRVLVVERGTGAMERFALSDSAAAALRAVIDAAMMRTGGFVTEAQADVVSQPARGKFVRNQMLLTGFLYGPLMAGMTEDGQTGTALYLLAAGASYFITSGIGRSTTITRAQNTASTDAALRGAGIAAGALYTLAGDSVHDDTYSGVALAGALGGAIAGFRIGRGRTDSEVGAASSFSTFGAMTALGVAGASGAFDNDSERGAVGGIVGAGILGYALGPLYPRRSRYGVTSGDVGTLSLGAILGAAVAVTPFVDEDSDDRTVFGAATGGMLAGILFADRVMARRYDYTSWDATQVGLGLAAGALMGGATVVLAEPQDEAVAFGLITAGAILGTVGGHSFANPARAGTVRVGLGRHPSTRIGNAELKFDARALALGAAGVPGRHGILTLRF